MHKTAMIRARTEPRLKQEVERIFHALGLSCTEAINLFFRQVILRKGMPFEVRIPNKATREAIQDVEQQRGLMECQDSKELFKELDI